MYYNEVTPEYNLAQHKLILFLRSLNDYIKKSNNDELQNFWKKHKMEDFLQKGIFTDEKQVKSTLGKRLRLLFNTDKSDSYLQNADLIKFLTAKLNIEPINITKSQTAVVQEYNRLYDDYLIQFSQFANKKPATSTYDGEKIKAIYEESKDVLQQVNSNYQSIQEKFNSAKSQYNEMVQSNPQAKQVYKTLAMYKEKMQTITKEVELISQQAFELASNNNPQDREQVTLLAKTVENMQSKLANLLKKSQEINSKFLEEHQALQKQPQPQDHSFQKNINQDDPLALFQQAIKNLANTIKENQNKNPSLTEAATQLSQKLQQDQKKIMKPKQNSKFGAQSLRINETNSNKLQQLTNMATLVNNLVQNPNDSQSQQNFKQAAYANREYQSFAVKFLKSIKEAILPSHKTKFIKKVEQSGEDKLKQNESIPTQSSPGLNR